jgi:3',5'-cyclic AMP phosphodiesterase CpdA
MLAKIWPVLLISALTSFGCATSVQSASQGAPQSAGRTVAGPATTEPVTTMPATRPATTASTAPATAAGIQAAAAGETIPPVAENSVRFAVIGDAGTGERAQYETAAMLTRSRQVFPFEFVIMVGDNMYGSERPQDYVRKFETPYKALLDAKVTFYASLGNHDDPNQRFYKLFNMNGERFYTFKKQSVRFFALDSNYMDQDQIAWLGRELAGSGSDWKIPFFHHPLYSSGGTHGSEVDLRTQVEPLFLQYGVSAVFAGHEHFYERLKPQKGIQYFTSGAAAKLREGDIRRTNMTAVGFDADTSFMLVEIAGDVMTFQTLTRTGKRIDSGTVTKVNATTTKR